MKREHKKISIYSKGAQQFRALLTKDIISTVQGHRGTFALRLLIPQILILVLYIQGHLP